MGTEPLERKLAAILYADVAGYSHLTGEDEEGTHRTLSTYLDAITHTVEQHHGQVLHFAGDAVLVEFASVVNALTCAVAIQRDLKVRNEDLPEERKLQFRIGINLGDVIVDRSEIYGDGVNVAARLEGLAEPGGICISRAVYDQVKNKLELGYDYLGEREVKNIAEPVDAYRIRYALEGATKVPSVRKTLEPLSLPSRPSIAVLPFVNMSEDPANEYFSDGISEDITTDLSKFRELFVISRDSAFVYKERTVKTQDVGRDLGVRYVLEGSVRKTRNRVRINAQLVDTATGYHLWADRYDREIEDIFQVQDEVTQTIVGNLTGHLERAERNHALRATPESLEAYGFLLRGQQFLSKYSKKDNAKARRLYEKAIGLDPRYARAYAALSRTYNFEWRYSWSDSPADALEQALNLAKQAVTLDELDARGHSELGFVYLYKKQHDLSLSEYEEARRLNPNDADIMANMADALTYCKRSKEAVELLQKAMRLNPFYPDEYLWDLGGAYYTLRRYEDAVATLSKMHNVAEGCRLLAASYAQLGTMQEATAYARLVLQRQPNFSVEQWASVQPDTDPEELEHFKDGLRKAGLQ